MNRLMLLLLVAGLMTAPGCRSPAAARPRVAAVPCDHLHLVYETSLQRLGLQPPLWARIVAPAEAAAIADPSARCRLHVWRTQGTSAAHAVLVVQCSPPGAMIGSAGTSVSWDMPLQPQQMDELLLDLHPLAAESPAEAGHNRPARHDGDAALCLAIDGHTTIHCGRTIDALDELARDVYLRGRRVAHDALPVAPALPEPASAVSAYRRARQRELAAQSEKAVRPMSLVDEPYTAPRVVALPPLEGRAIPQRQ
jgi:hypothetical protein